MNISNTKGGLIHAMRSNGPLHQVLAIGHAEKPELIYDNPQLYPMMFPWLFPYGLGGIGTVPNLLGIRFFALHLGQNSVATNAMFDNRGTAILLAVRLVFCSAISKK